MNFNLHVCFTRKMKNPDVFSSTKVKTFSKIHQKSFKKCFVNIVLRSLVEGELKLDKSAFECFSDIIWGVEENESFIDKIWLDHRLTNVIEFDVDSKFTHFHKFSSHLKMFLRKCSQASRMEVLNVVSAPANNLLLFSCHQFLFICYRITLPFLYHPRPLIIGSIHLKRQARVKALLSVKAISFSQRNNMCESICAVFIRFERMCIH